MTRYAPISLVVSPPTDSIPRPAAYYGPLPLWPHSAGLFLSTAAPRRIPSLASPIPLSLPWPTQRGTTTTCYRVEFCHAGVCDDCEAVDSGGTLPFKALARLSKLRPHIWNVMSIWPLKASMQAAPTSAAHECVCDDTTKYPSVISASVSRWFWIASGTAETLRRAAQCAHHDAPCPKACLEPLKPLFNLVSWPLIALKPGTQCTVTASSRWRVDAGHVYLGGFWPFLGRAAKTPGRAVAATRGAIMIDKAFEDSTS